MTFDAKYTGIAAPQGLQTVSPPGGTARLVTLLALGLPPGANAAVLTVGTPGEQITYTLSSNPTIPETDMITLGVDEPLYLTNAEQIAGCVLGRTLASTINVQFLTGSQGSST